MNPVTRHEALGNVDDGDPSAERVSREGLAVVTRRGSTEVYRYEPPALQTYQPPPPLVADLGGSRQDPRARCERQTAVDTPRTEVLPGCWRAPLYEHFQNHVDPAGSGPTVCDMDGDGDNEVVATLAGPDGKPFCAILDGEGKLERRLDLEPGTVILNRGPTGSLGPGRGRWIILRMFYGEGPYQGRRPLVVAFDGKTGRKLWARDHYATYGPNPVIFAAHLPTAVHDLDGDGADDWLVCSENFYGVISVKDDREIVKPVVLSDAIPGHWTAYSYPSLGKVRAGGELHLLHNNAYSLALVTDLLGKPHWHHGLTRDTAGTWGILADVNGDGTSEFLHVQPDGLVRCFDARAPRSRCATCPTEAQSSGVRSEGARSIPLVSRSEASNQPHDCGRPRRRRPSRDHDGMRRRKSLRAG